MDKVLDLPNSSESFGRIFESGIITIKIGTEKTFFVHERAMAKVSKVLERQVGSEMIEGQTKTIQFDDFMDSGRAFSLFIQFAYLGNYVYDDNGKEDGIQAHASVYVLAERLDVMDLKDIAIGYATRLYSASSMNKVRNANIGDISHVALSEAVRIIYNGTYDARSGEMPSFVQEDGTLGEHKRDSFRMLLAKFTASQIKSLREDETFIATIEELPSFVCDILFFVEAGSAVNIGTQKALDVTRKKEHINKCNIFCSDEVHHC